MKPIMSNTYVYDLLNIDSDQKEKQMNSAEKSIQFDGHRQTDKLIFFEKPILILPTYIAVNTLE